MKTIIATGELGTLRNVRAASLVCMMAGARFHQDLNRQRADQRHAAGEPDHGPRGARLLRAHGLHVGFKPAVASAPRKQSLDWLALIKEELGDAWLRPSLFRIGASGLLTDIERQLWHKRQRPLLGGTPSSGCPERACTTASSPARSATCC